MWNFHFDIKKLLRYVRVPKWNISLQIILISILDPFRFDLLKIEP